MKKENKLANNKIFGIACLVFGVFTFLIMAHRLSYYIYEYDPKFSPVDYGKFNILSFFTIQSNVFVSIYLILIALASFGVEKVKKIVYSPLVGSLVTTYILITGLVYCCGIPLGFTAPFVFDNPYHSMSNFIQIYYHMIIPPLMLILWFFPLTNEKSKGKQCFYSFIYPFVYSIFSIIRGAVGKMHFYPYPFYKLEFFWAIFCKEKELNVVGAYFLMFTMLILGMFLFIGLTRLLMLIRDKMIDIEYKD